MRVAGQLLDCLSASLVAAACQGLSNPPSSHRAWAAPCHSPKTASHPLPHATCPAVPCSAAGLDNYIRLMKECWAQDPKQRPSFGPIARRLKAMQHWLHACTNALHLTSTANRLQSLRQDSSTRGAPVPLAVGGSLPAAVPPHVDAPATQVAMDARGLVGAPDAADAAAGGAAAAATAPLVAAAQPRQERQQPDHAALSSGTDEVPPPVPDPAVAAAAEASAPKPVAEPSVQVCVCVCVAGDRVPL